MKKFADMHMHTVHSDGTLSVKDVFMRAQEKNLSAIIITDHDCFTGFEESKYYSEKLGIETILGSEISTNHRGKDVHILAYGFDEKNRMLLSQMNRICDDRNLRAEKICLKLNNLGINILYEDVETEANGGNIGRPHIARVLIRMGVVSHIQEAFDKYLSDHAGSYVAKYKFDTKRAIEMINNAGGVSAVAHIGRYFSFKRISEFRSWGLKGIEIFHPSHSPEMRQKLLAYTEEHNMINTGGSDFHELGTFTDLGKQLVPYQYYDHLLKKIKDAV